MITTNSKGETSIVISKRGVTQERIKALSDAEIGKPFEFCVHLSRLNIGIVDAVIQVLQDFAQKKIVWDNFTLVVLSQISRDHQDYILRLLYAVNSLQMCEGLTIRHPVSFVSQTLRDLEHTLFLHGILENSRLKRLTLSININQCPPIDVRTLCTILETKPCLQQLQLQFSGVQQYDAIYSALAANRSLKKLMLLYNNGATDAVVADTVSMVANHASIRSFHLASHVFGAPASHAIEELLANSDIEEMHLFALSKEPILNIENVVSGVARSTNLNCLQLGSLETIDAAELLPLVFQKRNFKAVRVNLGSIPDEIFDELLSTKRRRSPLILTLPSGIVLEHSGRLHQLLEKHPELRLKPVKVPLEMAFKRTCDSNWFGRHLLDRPDTPLALWPSVLGQSGISHDTVCEMLMGRALIGRGNFHRLP